MVAGGLTEADVSVTGVDCFSNGGGAVLILFGPL